MRVRTRRRRSRRVARGLEWPSSNFAGVGYAARYGHPFRAPKWTSSSLERPFQEIAEDEQGEGGRCMGSCFHKEIWLSLRRQWGANRDPLCLCFSLSPSPLSRSFLTLFSSYTSFVRLYVSLSLSRDFSLRLSAVLWTLAVLSTRRLFHLITPAQYSCVRKRLDTRNCGNCGRKFRPFPSRNLQRGVNKYGNAERGVI